MVGPTGAYAVSVGALPPGVLNTLQPHVVNQELIVDAALTGDRQLALQAMVNDPLVRDFRTAPQLLDELLLAQAEFCRSSKYGTSHFICVSVFAL